MPKKDVKLSQNVKGNGKKKMKKNKRPISKFMTIKHQKVKVKKILKSLAKYIERV